MRFVVAGAGESGITVSTRLARARHDVVLIDRDTAALEAASERADVMTFAGDVRFRSVLRAAEVQRAHAVVTVTSSDSDNIIGAGLAGALGAQVTIARVDDPRLFDSAEGVERDVLGVDALLCATRLAASELLGQVARVDMSFLASFGSFGFRAALLPVREGSFLVGRLPQGLELPGGVLACGVNRDGFLSAGAQLPRLAAGDELLLAGDAHRFLEAWVRLVPEAASRRAVVVGGGDVGAIVAESLGGALESVALVERDRARAEVLGAELGGVTVLAGDARKSDFLEELRVGSADMLLAVTADDEINLLVSLLARRHGTQRVYALLGQPGHAELFTEVGVSGAAGAFELLAQTVQDIAVTDGRVKSAPLPNTGYELLEWRLPRRCGGSSRRLEDVPITPGGRVIGLLRGADALEVSPAAAVRGGDTLVVVTPRREAAELEKRLGHMNREMAA